MAAEVRQFEPGDELGILDLIVPIQREEFGIAITAAEQPDLADIADFYLAGKGGFWVAVDDGRIVGSIGLKDISDGCGAIRKMFVASDYRGSGVAPALLGSLMAAARLRGMGRIYLGTTDKFLAAHRFYEKQGFERIEAEALPGAFPRMLVDTRFYRADLR